MPKPTLHLMMGYPGSGKTITAKYIHELTGAVHIWADKVRIEKFSPPTHDFAETRKLYKYLDEKVFGLLSARKSVIYDTNFNFYIDRQRLREIANDLGADCTLVWVKVPVEVARLRSVTGKQDFGSRVFSLSEDSFNRKVRNLQEPRPDEPYLEVDGTNVSKEYIKEIIRPWTDSKA